MQRAGLDWELESILAARRERAGPAGKRCLHDSIASVCPAFVDSGSKPSAFRRRIPSPLVAKFAPRPVRPPWRSVAQPANHGHNGYSRLA